MAFLAALIGKERFRAGRLSTDFIAQEFPHGFSGAEIDAAAEADAFAVAAAAQRILAERDARITGQLAGRARQVPDEWVICQGERRVPVRATRATDVLAVAIGGMTRKVATSWQPWQPICRVSIDGKSALYQIARDGIGLRLSHRGAGLRLAVLNPQAARLLALMPVKQAADQSHLLLSPMPGLLISLAVAEGQEIKIGEELAVIEAMKMENVLRAERDGRVAKIHARPGDNLAADQIILEFAP
jgi:propionyl-CoA carboxylase alpha chain